MHKLATHAKDMHQLIRQGIDELLSPKDSCISPCVSGQRGNANRIMDFQTYETCKSFTYYSVSTNNINGGNSERKYPEKGWTEIC